MGNGGGSGALSYVGHGQGAYAQETTYQYVGHGGDFDVVRPRRDFTCIITGCCLLSLLLLLPLLLWLLSIMGTTSLPFDCDAGFMNWQNLWSAEQQQYCCMTSGRWGICWWNGWGRNGLWRRSWWLRGSRGTRHTASADFASSDASTSSSSSSWPCGSSQLRNWSSRDVVSGQENMVLQRSPCRLCNSCTNYYSTCPDSSCGACCTSRPVHLC